MNRKDTEKDTAKVCDTTYISTSWPPQEKVFIWPQGIMQKCAFYDTKSRPRVSKNTKKCIILMILFTKFRTDNLDYMRRGSNVVLRKKNHAKQ